MAEVKRPLCLAGLKLTAKMREAIFASLAGPLVYIGGGKWQVGAWSEDMFEGRVPRSQLLFRSTTVYAVARKGILVATDKKPRSFSRCASTKRHATARLIRDMTKGLPVALYCAVRLGACPECEGGDLVALPETDDGSIACNTCGGMFGATPFARAFVARETMKSSDDDATKQNL